MRCLLLIIVLLSAGGAQSIQDDPSVVLLEARKKVLSTLTELPRYICTETVSRRIFRPPVAMDKASCESLRIQQLKSNWKLHQTASDRLHLDVAVSGDHEMYSWANEKRFQSGSLADLVGGGETSTGAFATLLGDIFANNHARFTYRGSGQGHLVQFGFVVPLENSHYAIGTPQHHAIVAYEGTFVVDTRTRSLVQLAAHVRQVPSTLHVCEATTALDYKTNNIRGTDFLLPENAESVVIRLDGGEFQKRIAFSACREFHGESTLSFSQLHIGQTSAASSFPSESSFPAGLSFTVALVDSINPSIAAAGDVVRAKLIGPIRGKHKTTLAPTNSIVVGRLVQVEKISGVYGPGVHSLRVGVKLETIEIEGAVRPFVANLMSIEKRRIKPVNAPTEGQWNPQDRLVRREDLGSFDQMMNPDDAAVGYLLFDDVADDYIIRAGTQMTGTTTYAEAGQ